MPRNGLQEHVFTLKTDIADFLHKSSKMYITFIDIKDAFGSIDHKIMLNELTIMGYPEQVISITRDIYQGSTFQVKTSSGLTKPITRHKGIIQGCPWSVIIFEQGIDKWLRWIEQGSTRTSSPNPIQGYVDDVDMAATNENEIQVAAEKTNRFMNYCGMEVKHRKCATLHGQRTGNNWSKRDGTAETELEVQGSTIPKYNKDQSYTYLGHEINLSNTADENQVKSILQEFKDTLSKIDIAPLAVAAKIQAINVMATSKLHFYFPNIQFTDKALENIENTIVFFVRSWLGLNQSSTRSFMFCPRSEGGLGLLHPRNMYYAKKLSFILSVLNSDDEQTRNTARYSLALHLEKRKCTEAARGDDRVFAGYTTDENYHLLKKSKVLWRKSLWIHVNDICARNKIQLQRNSEHMFVLKFWADEEVQMSFTDPKAFFTSFKRHQLQGMMDEWREKQWQGQIARNEHANTAISSSHLTNLRLSDKLTAFIVKARLLLLECNSRLHTYSPEVPKACDRCGFYTETVSHLLNGCREHKNSIQNRHNRILALVADAVKDTCHGDEIVIDSIIRPMHFQQSSEAAFVDITHTRPDICIIKHEAKLCLLVEVAVPFDQFLGDAYSHKFFKYLPLCQKISDMGYQCKVIVLVIGSLGLIHKRFVSGLQIIGLPKNRAKAIARYCSVSAMIGSLIIWKQRCRATVS